MSRAVIFETLSADSALNAVGIDINSVFPNYSLEIRPRDDGPFLILRWETSDVAFHDEDLNDVAGPHVLTIWAHYPIELGDDFVKVDNLLTLVGNAIRPLHDVTGIDGSKLRHVRWTGNGPDIKDDGFNTVTRWAAYEILYQ